MKRVLLDVDGVIADFLGWYHYTAEVTLRRTLEIVNPTSWSIPHQFGLDEREFELVEQVVHDSDAREIRFYPSACQPVRELLEHPDIDVYFVTAPFVTYKTWEWCRRQNFREQFGDDAVRRLIFTDAKHTISADLLVDDKPSNVNEWVLANFGSRGVLWAQHYNIGAEQVPGVARSSFWNVVKEILGI